MSVDIFSRPCEINCLIFMVKCLLIVKRRVEIKVKLENVFSFSETKCICVDVDKLILNVC
jgi:hypothetical protein